MRGSLEKVLQAIAEEFGKLPLDKMTQAEVDEQLVILRAELPARLRAEGCSEQLARRLSNIIGIDVKRVSGLN